MNNKSNSLSFFFFENFRCAISKYENLIYVNFNYHNYFVLFSVKSYLKSFKIFRLIESCRTNVKEITCIKYFYEFYISVNHRKLLTFSNKEG